MVARTVAQNLGNCSRHNKSLKSSGNSIKKLLDGMSADPNKNLLKQENPEISVKNFGMSIT